MTPTPDIPAEARALGLELAAIADASFPRQPNLEIFTSASVIERALVRVEDQLAEVRAVRGLGDEALLAAETMLAARLVILLVLRRRLVPPGRRPPVPSSIGGFMEHRRQALLTARAEVVAERLPDGLVALRLRGGDGQATLSSSAAEAVAWSLLDAADVTPLDRERPRTPSAARADVVASHLIAAAGRSDIDYVTRDVESELLLEAAAIAGSVRDALDREGILRKRLADIYAAVFAMFGQSPPAVDDPGASLDLVSKVRAMYDARREDFAEDAATDVRSLRDLALRAGARRAEVRIIPEGDRVGPADILVVVDSHVSPIAFAALVALHAPQFEERMDGGEIVVITTDTHRHEIRFDYETAQIAHMDDKGDDQ
jgi:hypothetical protein